MQEHYMIREIREGPEALRRTLDALAREVEGVRDLLESREIRRGFVIGSGTSYHASLVLQYLVNKFANYRLVSVPASEFADWAPDKLKGEVVLAFSQSGESTDVIVSVKMAKERGATVVGITNTPGSTLTKLSDAYLLTRAGEERAVTATKTYDAQLIASYVLALSLSERGEAIDELKEVIRAVESVLKRESVIKELAEELKRAETMFVLGRGVNYPNALEASLKLKEAAMIHAEGFAVREFLHGPIQLVDETTPVLALIPSRRTLEESRKTLDKLMGYKAPVVAVRAEGVDVGRYSAHEVEVPSVEEEYSTLTVIKAVQMLAYYTAIARGLNPDKPTKLTKVVK